jgi:hypothetical protein
VLIGAFAPTIHKIPPNKMHPTEDVMKAPMKGDAWRRASRATTSPDAIPMAVMIARNSAMKKKFIFFSHMVVSIFAGMISRM